MKVYADVFSRPKILGKHEHLKINQRLLPQPETYPINLIFRCSCARRLGLSPAVNHRPPWDAQVQWHVACALCCQSDAVQEEKVKAQGILLHRKQMAQACYELLLCVSTSGITAPDRLSPETFFCSSLDEGPTHKRV